MRSAIAAVSLLPSSMACRVCARACRFCLIRGVPLGDAGVEIPAVEVEARLGGEGLNFGARFFLELREAYDYVCDLHSGVVDVVLHVDVASGGAEEAHEGVAEDGVAQVADVGGFVGIDAGVLDENLARWQFRGPVSDRRRVMTARAARLRRALMYPAPATSSFSNPSTAPRPATTSSAILRGALRSFLASSKARGRAYSPSSTFGGCSMTTVASSRL